MTLLDLHMPIDPEGTVAAVAPLAWCVTKDLLAQVEASGFVNPHLFVAVRTRKSQRIAGFDIDSWDYSRAFVVPLENAMQYVSFSRPGENEMLCFVIDVPNAEVAKGVRKVIRILERRDDHINTNDIIEDDGRLSSFVRSYYSIKALNTAPEVLTVHVPAAMFAAEPAEWRKRIVKTFFKSKTRDQCHFRKRFWFAAFPLSIPVAIVLNIFKAIVLVLGLLLGFRGVDWNVAKRPLAFPPEIFGFDAYFAPAMGPDKEPRLSVWSVLNLPVVLVLVMLYLIVTSVGIGTIILVLAIVAVFAALAVGVFVLFDRNVIQKFLNDWETKKLQRNKEHRTEALEAMLCTDRLPANSLKDLPSEKRTVSLRFANLKTKVCRPFAS